jgi:hypothetical protein
LPWAAFAATVGVALAVSRLFGPVLASAAEGFWLLDAPISRAKLLRSRLVAAVLAAFLAGAVIGALISALTGSGLVEVLVWAAATALSAAASVAFAAAQQGIERHRLTHLATYVFGLLAVGALFSVVGVAAGWFSLDLSANIGIELGLIMIAASTLVLLISAVLAAIRLAEIRRTRLLSGGALVSGVSGAFFALDVGLARDIVVERRAIERGHVHPKRGKGVGLEAIIWREWQRLWRFPQPMLVLAATIVVPYAADALGMSTLTPVFAALALFGATIPLLGGLRVLTRTGGLARCLPFSLARLKLASIAVPGILAAVWAIATTPAYLGFGGVLDGGCNCCGWAAVGSSLDAGERRGFRSTHGRQSSWGVSSRSGDQPVPRIRRLHPDHCTDAARPLPVVVAGDRGHCRGDPAQLDGCRNPACPSG